MLRGLWSLAVLIVSTTILGIPAVVGSLLLPGSEATMRVGRLWSRIMLTTVGARVYYEGLEHIDPQRSCLFIANHLSNIDIWALVRVVPRRTRFVAKKELRKVPVIGWAMAASGFVFIDRADRASAIRSLDEAAQQIRSGRPVILFAEGTRSRDGRLHSFKKGPFHLALRAGVPVIPVAISGSWGILKPRRLAVTPGTVRVRFLPPVSVAPYQPDDVSGLLEAVHALIRQALGPAQAPVR